MKAQLKKPTKPMGPDNPQFPWTDKEFVQTYPHLYAFLSQTRWEDGTDRTPGTLAVFVQEGILKACCNDKGMKRVGFVTASTFALLLDSVEERLADDTLDWRTHRS